MLVQNQKFKFFKLTLLFCWYYFFDYQGMMPGNAIGSHVIISRIKVNPTGNPDTVSYLGAPPDVVSARGIPAAPFANFPLTVTP